MKDNFILRKEFILRKIEKKILPLEKILQEAAEYGITPSEKILSRYANLHRRWERVIKMKEVNGNE